MKRQMNPSVWSVKIHELKKPCGSWRVDLMDFRHAMSCSVAEEKQRREQRRIRVKGSGFGFMFASKKRFQNLVW